jgi:hypothetical protein
MKNMYMQEIKIEGEKMNIEIKYGNLSPEHAKESIFTFDLTQHIHTTATA